MPYCVQCDSVVPTKSSRLGRMNCRMNSPKGLKQYPELLFISKMSFFPLLFILLVHLSLSGHFLHCGFRLNINKPKEHVATEKGCVNLIYKTFSWVCAKQVVFI